MGAPIRHAFTVDVEDWFHGIPIDEQTRATAQPRLRQGLDPLLKLLSDAGVRGTLFVLGPVARDYPQVVRDIAAEGHEVGCHGWSHDLLYTMTPERMRDETRRAVDVIQDLTGRPVTSYRAACFSITRRSFWALEQLASLGFRYDSSVFPVRNWRYGIEDFDPHPQRIDTAAGVIYEWPISVRRIFGLNIPVSGGAYFRIYPYMLSRANFQAAEETNRPVVFYLHPWELDPDHPRVQFNWKPRLTHYINLRSTEPKLKRLLRDFRFAPLGEVLDDELTRTRS